MSRITYADARLAQAEARRLEEERLRSEEEGRRRAILAELQRLRGRLGELASETAELARRVEKLGAEAGGHPAAAPALEAFEQRRRVLEALIAGLPKAEDGADSTALSRTREQVRRLLSLAESQLGTLKSFLPHVEEGVAEARRQSFEARVFAGVATPTQEQAVRKGGTPLPPKGVARPMAPGPAPQAAPAERAAALAVLAKEATAVRETLAELGADLPPEMRLAVEELADAVATFTAMRENPSYAATQLLELGRQLRGYVRSAAEHWEEREQLRTALASGLGELRALAANPAEAGSVGSAAVTAAATSRPPEPLELEATIADGVLLAELPWPGGVFVGQWLKRARSLADLTRSRLARDAQRRRVLDLVRDALAELGYEALLNPAPARSAADSPLEQVFLSPHGGGVSVSVAGDGALLSEVVRFVKPGSETTEPTLLESDRLARQTKNWCSDYTAMVGRLQERGVVTLTERWRDESTPDCPRAVARPRTPRRTAATGRRSKRRHSEPAGAPGGCR